MKGEIKTMNSDQLYKLSPSDFKYLWEQCKHCYYRKAIFNISQPSIGLPTIFSKMQGMLQSSLQGVDPHALHPDLPHGKFILQERWIKSAPLPPNKKTYISGRFDLLAEFNDGTFGVIDAKMTDQKEESLAKFSRQLHAYKYALENPLSEDTAEKYQISKMGLLILSPSSIENIDGEMIYKGKPIWMEIPEDVPAFFDFIGEVEKLLSGSVPAPSSDCNWCKFKHAS